MLASVSKTRFQQSDTKIIALAWIELKKWNFIYNIEHFHV